MPKRLLGTGIKAVAPELIQDPLTRKHVTDFMAGYKAWKNDNVDQLTLLGLTLADTADAILTKVGDPTNAKAVREFLETTPIASVQTIRWTKDRHVGMTSDDVAILEYKQGRWVKADPLK